MAQNISYLALSATFTPTGGSATPILDLEHVSYGESGQEVVMSTDAAIAANGIYIDTITGEVTIQTSEILLLQASNAFAVGTPGSLAIVYAKRKAGIGQVSGANRTLTLANSVVASTSPDAGATGASVVAIRFRCYDPAGLAVSAWT